MELDLKETAVALIPKDELAFIKDDEGFKKHIIANLSSSLAERIIGILEREDEIIVRLSDLRVSEYIPTNSVEYRRQINWSPLVRCKECKHRNGSACDYSAVWVRENGFCQWGERSDDDNDREQ